MTNAPIARMPDVAATGSSLPGYWLAHADGTVTAAGDAAGNLPATTPPAPTVSPVVAAVTTPQGGGYWLAHANGAVTAFGDARSLGGLAGRHLAAPIVGLAATPDGKGYWLVAADGGVFSFGDARFLGSIPGLVSAGRLTSAPKIVGIAGTVDGDGYWLAGADGTVFAFGDATAHGSAAGLHLAAPIVGMAATTDGDGYWLAGADGRVYAYGDATLAGSTAPGPSSSPVVSISPTFDGGGYWLAHANGTVTAFGDAPTLTPRPRPSPAVAAPVVAITASDRPVPAEYVNWATQAARSCPGLSWTVLAGIAKVESDFGQSRLPGVHTGANRSGAEGPMQFLPATFAVYDQPTPAGGVRPASPYDPDDAMWAAARLLCANGAAAPATLGRAIFAYNHAGWYVNQVEALAASYQLQTGGPAGAARIALAAARSQLGVPYTWGGETPDVGFDCSGLVQWAYRKAGISLPRTSQAQWAALAHLPAGTTLQPGDLVFFAGSDGTRTSPGHVGIYIGNGQMIDAPYTGTVIRVDTIDWTDYVGAARP